MLQSPSAVILEPPKIKSATDSIVSPSICHEVMGPDAMILVFSILNFKRRASLSSFTFINRLFSSSLLSTKRVISSIYLRLLIFLPEILIPACVSSSPTFSVMYSAYRGVLSGSVGKESTCDVGDLCLIPGLGRSPGEGNGYPLWYSGLENSMDCIDHGVTKSWTQLSDFHFTSLRIQVKKAGWQYTALMYSFPNLEPVCYYMSGSNSYSWPAYKFLRRQVKWSGIPTSLRISHSLLWFIQSKALV